MQIGFQMGFIENKFSNVFSVLVPFPTRPIVAGVEEELATLTRVTGKPCPFKTKSIICVFLASAPVEA